MLPDTKLLPDWLRKKTAVVSYGTAARTGSLGRNASTMPGGARQATKMAKTVQGLVRVLTSITGGLFLLAPIIIMTFVKPTKYRLIIVSISVLLFAIAIALMSKAAPQELLAATAAYSAVLVVYIGSASGSST